MPGRSAAAAGLLVVSLKICLLVQPTAAEAKQQLGRTLFQRVNKEPAGRW